MCGHINLEGIEGFMHYLSCFKKAIDYKEEIVVFGKFHDVICHLNRQTCCLI